MAIPESQLDTWSKQGAIAQSKTTYNDLKDILESSKSPYYPQAYTVFLQGSYGNDTNIFADSDVDVVIRLDSTFRHDLDNLSEAQRTGFHQAYSNATYTFPDFKRDVQAWLTQIYGSSVKPGTKAIFIEGQGNRRDADVLVAMAYRRYHSFSSMTNESFTPGICFFTSSGAMIINYPKQHSENCTSKHEATAQWFKPMVRVLKNMRNRMIDGGLIRDGLAPSYFIEGMLYNVPNDKFGGSYSNTFERSINWLLQTDRSKLVCANEQYMLLHGTSPVTWRAADCTEFLTKTTNFWNNW